MRTCSRPARRATCRRARPAGLGPSTSGTPRDESPRQCLCHETGREGISHTTRRRLKRNPTATRPAGRVRLGSRGTGGKQHSRPPAPAHPRGERATKPAGYSPSSQRPRISSLESLPRSRPVGVANSCWSRSIVMCNCEGHLRRASRAGAGWERFGEALRGRGGACGPRWGEQVGWPCASHGGEAEEQLWLDGPQCVGSQCIL